MTAYAHAGTHGHTVHVLVLLVPVLLVVLAAVWDRWRPPEDPPLP